jgi:hypothetical protein
MGRHSTNDREEQRNFITYNHLVANCLISQNVFSLSRVLHDLQREGYPLDLGWSPRSARTSPPNFIGSDATIWTWTSVHQSWSTISGHESQGLMAQK